MALRRILLAVAGAAAFSCSPLAAQQTAPTYRGTDGTTREAQGTFAMNPDGSPLTGSAPYTVAATGTLAALNATVDIVAPGSGSAVIAMTSTNFAGTVAAYGCADAACTVLGGRLLFKSGVGSIGTNQIVLTGTAISREYRVVGGGNRIRIVATAYTSGSLSVIGLAQAGNNILFVNGPVHSGEEEAVRNGRGYIMTTQLQSVAAGNYLNAMVSNPSSSGVNVFVVTRMFECNAATGTTPQEWTTYGNPTSTLANTATPSNRMVGGKPTAEVFTWGTGTTPLAGGIVADNGTIVTGGGPTMVQIMSMIVPGQTVGVSIGGSGGGLGATARCKASYVTYEESVN